MATDSYAEVNGIRLHYVGKLRGIIPVSLGSL
jgi:hypothetical protein